LIFNKLVQKPMLFFRLKIIKLKKYLINTLHIDKNYIIFALVFHRILDFKAGLDFYLGPFFLKFLRFKPIKQGFLLYHNALCPQQVSNG